MASFLEREQLVPTAPVIAPADQILGELQVHQGLYGMGAAQVKSAQSAYGSLALTNSQNQSALDTLNKQANEELKTASLRDMSIGQNREAALGVFDPIVKDSNIMGDHALTQYWGKQRSSAEGDRVTNGGKAYNKSAVDAINMQQQLFANSDKSTWKQFYANKESYNSYYDKTAEMASLQKMFKTDVIEKDEQHGAYIATTKNSSWYKDKWQQFVEANASPQLKSQLGLEARAEYYRDMLTMDKTQMVDKYTGLRNSLIDKQQTVDKENLLNVYTSLSAFTDSKDNAPLRAHLLAQKDYLEKAYLNKDQMKRNPLEGRDAIGDVNSLSAGTRIAEQLAQYKYFDRVGDAFAHQEIKQTIKPDYAYLSLTKIREESRQFNLRQGETNRHNRVTEVETGRHNKADEQIGLLKAINTGRGKAGKNGTGTGDEDDDTTDPTNRTGNLENANDLGANSNPTDVQKQGQTVLEKLNDNTKEYEAVADVSLRNIFSNQFISSIDELLKDPKNQNLTLRDLPDPTKAADGSGGISNRVAQFLAGSQSIIDTSNPNVTRVIDNPGAAYGLKLTEVRQMMKDAVLHPEVFKTGLEAIKKNDPSIDSYKLATDLELAKQKIDGRHAQVTNNAIPLLRNSLGKYSKYFEESYFAKGKIPTAADIKSVVDSIPDSGLDKELTSNSNLTTGDRFSRLFGSSLSDVAKERLTDNITKGIYGTLGNSRVATNTQYRIYSPDKGDAEKDPDFKANMLHLIEGAETATKGNGGPKVDAILQYAKNNPGMVEGLRMNTVSMGSDQPTMEITFKAPKRATDKVPESGVKIPTTNANRSFYNAISDDRTDLLNNGSLKFQADYADGTKSNLSIYNESGSPDTPMLDINKDFSYKTLDIDPQTGNIKGVRTVYKSDLVNSWAGKGSSQFMIDINRDPAAMHSNIAKGVAMNRDAVNEYLKSNGAITNVSQLPEYIKNLLPR